VVPTIEVAVSRTNAISVQPSAARFWSEVIAVFSYHEPFWNVVDPVHAPALREAMVEELDPESPRAMEISPLVTVLKVLSLWSNCTAYWVVVAPVPVLSIWKRTINLWPFSAVKVAFVEVVLESTESPLSFSIIYIRCMRVSAAAAGLKEAEKRSVASPPLWSAKSLGSLRTLTYMVVTVS